MRQTSQLRLLEKNSAQFFIGKVSTCSPTVSFWKPEVETYLLVYFSFTCSDFGEKIHSEKAIVLCTQKRTQRSDLNAKNAVEL